MVQAEAEETAEHRSFSTRTHNTAINRQVTLELHFCKNKGTTLKETVEWPATNTAGHTLGSP
jgi:hypothetical protein